MATISTNAAGECEAASDDCSDYARRYRVSDGDRTATLCGYHASTVKNGYAGLGELLDARLKESRGPMSNSEVNDGP